MKQGDKYIVCITFLLCAVVSSPSYSQHGDCVNAYLFCGTSENYPAPDGFGSVQELVINDTTSTCLLSGEINSTWIKLIIRDAGILEFDIIPDKYDDYDFAIFNLTNTTCQDIINGNLSAVRCNYAYSLDTTGLRSGFLNNTEPSNGHYFCAPLNVSIGEVYAIVINNLSIFTSGFTFSLANSTATTAVTVYEDNKIKNVSCSGVNSLTVQFELPVNCDIINTDGSDFALSGSGVSSLTGASPVSCHHVTNQTDHIEITYTGIIDENEDYILTVSVFDSTIYNLNSCTFIIPSLNDIDTFQCISTSIQTAEKDKRVFINPNPARNMLNISAPSMKEDFTIRIYDITGRMMLEDNLLIGNVVQQVDISFLANGSYFVIVSNQKKSYSFKFVIIK